MSERLDELHNWLRGNVISPSTPKVIVLTNFEVDWKTFEGKFTLKLDSDEMNDKFKFSIEIDGKYQISPPFYISPLGVPGSYPKIYLTEETTDTVTSIINDFFPKMKPLGLDSQSGHMIDRNTSIKDRVVDVEDVIWKMNKVLTDGFQLSWIKK